jgi:hypothetical protein
VDPTTANAGGLNTQLVERNVRNSLRAFEDDDMQGDDDGGDHGNKSGDDGNDGNDG